jgi:phospholipase C
MMLAMRGLLGIALLASLVGCATAGDDAPAPDKTPYWAAGSTTDEGKSTHLWIVNRAIAILGKHQNLPAAARAYTRLTSAACSTRWRQGLDDADHKVTYNNWYTWRSHFFDPSTGTNYLGEHDPIAYTQALAHLATARSRIAANDVYKGCYELGLSLHYATDILQPMHAANFAATDWPINLHSHLEDRAVDVQSAFTVTDWTTTPSGTVGTVLSNLAWTSHAQWPGTWNAVANAYANRCDDIDSYYRDHTECWSGDGAVDAVIGTALRGAQIGTAAFLFAADVP